MAAAVMQQKEGRKKKAIGTFESQIKNEKLAYKKKQDEE